MSTKKIPAISPGEILVEEFLTPFNISQYRLAKDVNVPPRRINEIVHGARSISIDTALRLSKYFKTTPQFWLNLQSRYDLENQDSALLKKIEQEVKIFEVSEHQKLREIA